MRVIQLLTVTVLCLALSGCDVWARWKLRQAQADLTQEQAEILKGYRECLQEFRGKPELAKQNCEHYTQALTVLDVRGLK